MSGQCLLADKEFSRTLSHFNITSSLGEAGEGGREGTGRNEGGSEGGEMISN